MILTVRLPLDVYHSSYFEGPRPVTFPNLNLLLNILVVCVCVCVCRAPYSDIVSGALTVKSARMNQRLVHHPSSDRRININ